MMRRPLRDSDGVPFTWDDEPAAVETRDEPAPAEPGLADQVALLLRAVAELQGLHKQTAQALRDHRAAINRAGEQLALLQRTAAAHAQQIARPVDLQQWGARMVTLGECMNSHAAAIAELQTLAGQLRERVAPELHAPTRPTKTVLIRDERGQYAGSVTVPIDEAEAAQAMRDAT
jgi:hypothetical protein